MSVDPEDFDGQTVLILGKGKLMSQPLFMCVYVCTYVRTHSVFSCQTHDLVLYNT